MTHTLHENLPAAHTRLTNAIHTIAHPKPATTNPNTNTITWTEPLYQQLRDTLDKQQGTGTRAAGSQLPVSIDALQLITEIDTTVQHWHPPLPDGAKPATLRRLHAIDTHNWRPQDTPHMHEIAHTIERWHQNITHTLEPEPIKTVSAPCPACGAKTVYRRDNAGETVRQPALQIIAAQGCTCLACKHTWGPDRYLLLAKVLGCQTPNGLIE